MDIKKHWPTIQSVFHNGQSSSKHCAIATVNADGSPHITPIGSLFLRDDCTGYYFENFTEGMPDNFKHNQRICILVINSDTKYWLKSLFGGRFSSPPGVRLYGSVGLRRMGTDKEIDSFQNRVRKAHRLRGYKIMWKDMKYIREITFESFKPVTASKMTLNLWQE